MESITNEQLKATFEAIDKNNDGFLSFSEIRSFLNDDGCSQEDVQKFFDEPVGEDTKITLEKFQAAFQKIPDCVKNKMGSVRKAAFIYLFDEANVDKNDFLSIEELTDALKKGGFNMSEEKISEYFQKVDTSADKKISREEFLAAMENVSAEDYKKALMRSLFRKLDKDNSGALDISELKALCSEQFGVDEEHIKKVMKEIDANDDGVISYEEFVTHFS